MLLDRSDAPQRIPGRLIPSGPARLALTLGRSGRRPIGPFDARPAVHIGRAVCPLVMQVGEVFVDRLALRRCSGSGALALFATATRVVFLIGLLQRQRSE